jgi:asparagine synthase (glutamine-hydrolysing)
VPFLDHRVVNKVINLPLGFRVGKRTDKWALKEIAARYLPTKLVSRKKVGFPLPLHDYLAPLARIELFDKGFCTEVLGLNTRGIQDVIDTWDKQIQGFFNLVSLEVWGRLFLMHEPLEQITESLSRFEHK